MAAVSKVRSLELYPDHHCGSWGPNTWATFCCFPRHVSKELDWKWCGQCANWYSLNADIAHGSFILRYHNASSVDTKLLSQFFLMFFHCTLHVVLSGSFCSCLHAVCLNSKILKKKWDHCCHVSAFLRTTQCLMCWSSTSRCSSFFDYKLVLKSLLLKKLPEPEF